MPVPKLRFLEFNQEIPQYKINEIFDVKTGLTPLRSKSEYFSPKHVDWIKTLDLNDSFIYKTEESISEIALQQTSLSIIPSNTVLIAMYGGFNQIGRTGLTTKPSTTNQAISALIPKDAEQIIPQYIQIYLNAHKNSWKSIAASSRKDPNITKKDIEKFNIPLPSLLEQQKLANFLGLLENKIHLQKRKIDLLKEQKKGYMQKIFSQELRFKKKYKDDYPAWEKIKLGKLTKKTGKKNSEGMKYPVAAISNKKGFTLEGERNYSNADVDIKAYKLVHKNEFAYNPARINVGSFGFQNVTDIAIVSSLYVIFETLPTLSNAYLKAYMHSGYFNRDVIKNTEGSVREYLFYENFSNIKIPLPCIEEQEKIAEFFLKLDSKIQLEEQKSESLHDQKQAFMQQMFI